MKKGVNVATITLLVIIVLAVVYIFALVFGEISDSTVIKTIESPNGNYYAEVIESDQGALGGNTLVYVYKDIDIFNKNLKIRCKKLYQGSWGEFKNMNIHWKNDECIVINSVEYKI